MDARLEGTEALARVMRREVDELGRDVVEVVKYGMLLGIGSAARATAPSRAASPRKMPDKYKFRPIQKYSGPPRYFVPGRETEFTTEKPMSDASEAKRGVQRVTREIVVYSRRKKALVATPYKGEATGKYDKVSRIGRIPHYGAAKACWLKAYGLLPGSKKGGAKKMDGADRVAGPMPKLETRRSLAEYALAVTNTVPYVGKTSPSCVTEAVAAAARAMERHVVRTLKKMEAKRV